MFFYYTSIPKLIPSSPSSFPPYPPLPHIPNLFSFEVINLANLVFLIKEKRNLRSTLVLRTSHALALSARKVLFLPPLFFVAAFLPERLNQHQPEQHQRAKQPQSNQIRADETTVMTRISRGAGNIGIRCCGRRRPCVGRKSRCIGRS